MADQRVNVKVTTQGAGKAKTELKGVEGAISKMGKAVGIASAAYFGAKGLISGFSSVIKLAGVQEQAEKKLEVALGKRSQALLNQASALQQLTTFGDEAIIGVQASIGAFVDSEDQIKKATEATLDMAVAMGMDLKGAGDLIAKTLGSSTNALSRYGIEVTGAVGSTERLESLTENVAELFGGQASAQAETLSGSIEQMKNAIGDAGEELGKVLAPMVITTAKGIKALAEGVGEVIEGFKNFGKEVDSVFVGLLPQADIELGKFKERIKGMSEDELKDVVKEINKMQEAISGTVSSSELLNEKQLLLMEALDEWKKIQLDLNETIGITNELRRSEADVVGELDAEYRNFVGTQAAKISNQNKEANFNARLIAQYPEMAKALGLVNDEKKKSKSLTDDNISAIKSWAFALNSAAQINRDKSHANALFAKRAAQLEAIVNTASAMTEVLPNVPLSIAMGVLGAVQVAKIESAKFAKGGDFVTSGPQNILVGDNPGGRERVQVTPLSSPNINGPQGGVTVNIQGDFLGSEGQADKLANIIEQRSRLGYNRIAVNA